MIQLFFVALNAPRPQSTPINTIFDAVKPPVISEASPSAKFSFTLDTVEGKPITATQSAQVYFLPPSTTRFGYREKIYLMAQNKSYFGLDTQSIKYNLIGQEAIFKDNDEELRVDITTFNYSYEYFISSRSATFVSSAIPSRKEIETKAIDFLKEVGRYPQELAQGKPHIIYLSYDVNLNSITPVDRPQEANLVEVDFYRPDVNEAPIVPPRYFNSQNYVIMGFLPRESRPKIIRAQIKFFEKSEEQVGVYAVKSGEAAFNELKEGKGLIVSGNIDNKNIAIKKMFLGYFDPDEYQDYLQPVYVFLGDNHFAAYVSAVDNTILQKSSTSSQR